MDHFVQSTGVDAGTKSPFGTPCLASQVMDYYDGNTVTAMWNYAQNYSLGDNSFGVTFGPSAPGAINVTAGDTGNVDTAHEANNPSISTSTAPDGDLTPDGKGGFSLTNDAQPYWDDCSTRDAVAFKGTNIGDVLNRAGLSWGWFEGGFTPTTKFAAAAAATGHSGQPTSTFIPDEFAGDFPGKNVPANASNQALCDTVHPVGTALGGTGQWGYKDDYIPHHEPFEYYASTANPHHLTVPVNGAGRDTVVGAQEHRPGHPVLRQGGAAVQHPQPPVRHQRLRSAGGGDPQREAAGVGASCRQLREGAGLSRTAIPAIRTLPTSRRS